MTRPRTSGVYECIVAQEQTSAHAAGRAATSIVVSLSVPWRFRGSALCGLSQAVSARRPPMRRRNLARIAMAPPATPVTSPQLLRLVRRFTNRFRGNAAHAANRVKSAGTGARRQPFPCVQPTGPKLGQPRSQAEGEVVTEQPQTSRSRTQNHPYATPGATILAWRAGDRLLCASTVGLHPETGWPPGSQTTFQENTLGVFSRL
jgi:hypothetical protein